VLLHPLAYPDSDRLVAIDSGNPYQVALSRGSVTSGSASGLLMEPAPIKCGR
jgi:hypothetical protein